MDVQGEVLLQLFNKST